jgi:hypothetical protein
MVRSSSRISPTHYQILQVHPAAPLELVTAAYWRLVSLALSAGNSGKASEIAVYHLTRSYQVLASAAERAEYDRSLGIATAPLRPQPPKRGISPWMPTLWEAEPEDRFAGVDYYSFLRLDPLANPAIVSEAYTVMRNCYLRMVEQMQARPELINQFEEAYRVLSDPERRRAYDQARRRQRRVAAVTNASQHPHPEKPEPRTKQPQEPQAETLHTQKSQNVNGKRRAPKANANGTAVEVAGAEHAPAKTAPAAKKRPPRPPTVAPTSADRSSPNGGGVAPPSTQTAFEDAPGIQFKEVVRSFAAGSAAVLRRGGIGSISLAKKASQTLRGALLDVEPLVQDGMTPDEEQALLDRLSSVPGSSPPVETAPPRSDSGLLARLTLIGGPGFGTAFDVNAVPLTLGEDEGCDIALPGLAAEQARLLHRNGQFVLYSLTDEPRTSIHGDSIAWAVLQDGDSFEMGPYKLRFDTAGVAAAGVDAAKV